MPYESIFRVVTSLNDDLKARLVCTFRLTIVELVPARVLSQAIISHKEECSSQMTKIMQNSEKFREGAFHEDMVTKGGRHGRIDVIVVKLYILSIFKHSSTLIFTYYSI